MPRKRLNIRVSSTVRAEIDPHQVAGVLLDWYAHELKSGRITPNMPPESPPDQRVHLRSTRGRRGRHVRYRSLGQ